MLKLEKTCICKQNCMLSDPYNEILDFIGGREYQVDVYADISTAIYKVYNDGGYNKYVVLSEEKFKDYFTEVS